VDTADCLVGSPLLRECENRLMLGRIVPLDGPIGKRKDRLDGSENYLLDEARKN